MVGYEEGRVRYEVGEVKWRGGWYMRWEGGEDGRM